MKDDTKTKVKDTLKEQQPTIQEELKKLLRKNAKKKDVSTTLKTLDKAIHSEGNKLVKLVQDWESFGG